MLVKTEKRTASKQVQGKAQTLWVTSVAILVFLASIFLGRWQLKRAEEKKLADEKRQQQQVQIYTGKWQVASTLYLDNRVMDGRQGFYVFTALEQEGAGVYLVQRGWVARNFIERKQIPIIETLTTTQQIVARPQTEIAQLQKASVAGQLVRDDASEYPIVQSIDLEDWKIKHIKNRRFKGLLRQEHDPSVGLANDGLKRNWFKPSSTTDKHYAYAAQWFSFAVIAVVMYLAYCWRRFKPWRQN